ncbi:S41 family peptidase [Sandaracinobacteroides saxicola]|uniref:Peptidase S41 n=1 Tax=Sandaracinobacteroides saxicola TaxID=2759707 RepID=A0A7G5IFF3_9SPHN|nr:S41 family peptidase [Sandaracinobacteroides saxicola]QMW22095.1 peptidase S41 [Sandaracinobacteroides saxicola]
MSQRRSPPLPSEVTASRRALLRAGLGAGLSLAAVAALPAAEPPRDVARAQDFDELWTTLDRRYCYFGAKPVDWRAAAAHYRRDALAAPDDMTFQLILQRLLDELYDPHTRLSDAPDGARRSAFNDIVAVADGEAARVLARRGQAEAAGLQPGDRIRAIDGIALPRATAAVAPRFLTRPDPHADHIALNLALAGARGLPRTLDILRDGTPQTLTLRPNPNAPADPQAVTGRRLPGGIGLIRIPSFAEDSAIAAFDDLIAGFGPIKALLIDVRGNGGGDTAVARPIMGRFVATPTPYARMRRREGKGLSAPWTETVDPRGPRITAPVAVLIDHFSASMAEGFPMGMKAIANATLIGTPMMQLGAAVFPLTLDRSGIRAQYSAEPVYDIHDRPRDLLRPDIETPPGADIEAAAIAALAPLIDRG